MYELAARDKVPAATKVRQLLEESLALVEDKVLVDMAEAHLAEPADIILFSPAFASFGQYRNEYERNDDFLAAIKRLKTELEEQ